MSSFACIMYTFELLKHPENEEEFALEVYSLNTFMKLDLAAFNALSIFPKNLDDVKHSAENQQQANTLIQLLDRCRTQIGTRVLRRWLKQPLQDPAEINKRLDIVQYFKENKELREFMHNDFLRKIPDLDKLTSKFYKVYSKKKHNCALVDCMKVYQLSANLKALMNFITENCIKDAVIQANLQQPLQQIIEDFSQLEHLMERAIDLEKVQSNEYVVNSKFNEKLNSLNKQILKSQGEIEKLRKQVEDEFSMDVKLIESNSHTYLFESKKKDAYQILEKGKKKTQFKTITVKKGQITFTCEELQALCVEYNSLKEQYEEEQQAIVNKILDVIATYYPAIEHSAELISQFDILLNFANLVLTSSRIYVRPKICDQNKSVLRLKECRHPCLELITPTCIANTCEMDKETGRFHIITGPNMGGKSTYIRQVAICVLLAHIGCYVPADEAEVPIIDAIITRVGASDMQLRGISTFMSEMLEASCMLQVSTENSLLIIDELGRGTSTSEGFGIAWAISDYIAQSKRCFCLFATHFFEMTSMEQHVKGVVNYYVSCLVLQGKLTMQYKVKRGCAEKSYGLFVAEILDFPREIMVDAQNKLSELESYDKGSSKKDISMEVEEATQGANSQGQLPTTQEFMKMAQGASYKQKEQIVNLALVYKDRIAKETNASSKQQLFLELKQKVSEILSKNQVPPKQPSQSTMVQ